MTREEEIIKGLESVKKECGKHLDESFAWICEPIDKAIKALEQEPRWIPVSERLPEDGERVLVTYDKIVIRATWDLMRYKFYDTHAVSLDKDFVYAWMPLPEPYKAERARNKK